MRRHNRQRARLQEVLEDRGREGGPLFGIGAGAELVEEDQRLRRHALENALEPHEVGREGRQMFEDALVIPDEHVDIVDHREPGPLARRHRETAEPHGHEEPHGLERDGLATGIRPADDERGRSAIQ
jgi:hypothetical protein